MTIKIFYRLLVCISLLSSCAAGNKSFDKKKYRQSKILFTYSGMASEFEDAYLLLKENGYFKYYQKIWIAGNIKESTYVGRYAQSNDTIYLNWLLADPKKIKTYLSSIVLVDPAKQSIWFISEVNGDRLWGLNERIQKGKWH